MYTPCIPTSGNIARAVKRTGVLVFIASTFFVGYVPSLHAAPDWNFEKLLMPGDLIEGHAKYESDCTHCHVSFEKSSQDRLCLDCHETVAADVDQKSGFHGLTVPSAEAGCRACHVDHQGRQQDIVQLDIDNFDHLLTDFSLAGKHLKLACASCHSISEKYRDAPGECIDCHENSDRHNGSLGEDCASCHSEEAWRDAKFDHSSTQFSLIGGHEELACNACHPGERYKDIPKQCNSCHSSIDVHRGKHGQQCEDCHGEQSWDEILFDHDRDSDFALLGTHSSLPCEACHRGTKLSASIGNLCIDCHQNHDTHSGKNGKECQDCHDESAWDAPKFNHDTDTEFDLKGKHAELDCGLCHSGALYDVSLQTECVSCHLYTDIHRGKQGKQCNNCHNEKNWLHDVVFDHDLTDFPLIGLHAIAPCEECHVTGSYVGTAVACDACHKDDDEHSGTLGANCFDCHTPAGWDLWRFDHSVQTEYPLEGAHHNLVCDACHKQRTEGKVRQSSKCVSCHRNDDRHAGSYGDRCDRCHVSDSFDKLQKLFP